MLGGVAVVKALIARFLFSEHYTFRKNAATRLLPTALLLVAAAVMTWIGSGGNLRASYLALRIGLTIPALVLGALAVNKQRSH